MFLLEGDIVKLNKGIFLTVSASILIGLILVYSVFSTGLLYLAIYKEDKWNDFKNYIFQDTNEKMVKKTIGNVINGTVTLTIPKEIIAFMGEDYDYTLTSEQKENGFTDVKKNDDGSAVFTIKKEDYDKFIKELEETTKASIKETINLISQQGNSSIKSIKYQTNFEKITVYAEKVKFGNGFDNLYIYSVGLTACMYQMFNINSDGKCIIDIVDVNTKEVFKTIVCPDEFNNENLK